MSRSGLEERFATYWRVAGRGIVLEREVRLCEGRRFRFDFAHLPSRVAIEVEGGTWSRGAHSTGRGIQRDCEKGNLAILHGWDVFRLTKEMITLKTVEEIAQYIITKSGGKSCQTSSHSQST